MDKEVQEEQVESIGDALRASFEEIETEEETETSEVEATQEDSEPELEAEAEEHSEEGAPEVEAKEDDDDAEPEKVFQAPEHWPSDDKAAFEQLPEDAKELVLARDKSFQTGYQEKAQSISAIQQAIEPWEGALAQRGVTADQAIRTLFAAHNAIESNPLGGILQLAQNFGVLDQLKSQLVPDTDDDFSDPEVKALKQEVTNLNSRLNQNDQSFQQQQQSTVQEQLNSFVNAVDDNGNPKHPHYENVRALMAPLVNQGKSLEDAYAETVWSVPEYRESQAKVTEESEVEKAKKVKQAKKAARSINQDGTAKTSESDEPLDLKSDLELAWKQHSA